jgi:hypothetical protein
LAVFHDITPCESQKKVYKLRNEVKASYAYKEFIHAVGKEAMGIGTLRIVLIDCRLTRCITVIRESEPSIMATNSISMALTVKGLRRIVP